MWASAMRVWQPLPSGASRAVWRAEEVGRRRIRISLDHLVDPPWAAREVGQRPAEELAIVPIASPINDLERLLPAVLLELAAQASRFLVAERLVEEGRLDGGRGLAPQLIQEAHDSTLRQRVGAAQAGAFRYWAGGAVADQLTGGGYPLVFRVGATGANLGEMSSHFAAQVLAPRLNLPPRGMRMAIVHNVDGYPTSVATAVAAQAEREGIQIVANVVYDAHAPDWASVLQQVRTAQPNILVLASYIVDGIDFRRAMLKSGLHVDAFIGSTMAQCVPDFGAMLGADAIGVFASDRPPHGFNPEALNDTGKAIYARFAAAYRGEFGTDPTEESLAGFSAAWTLFHYVMPKAHDLDAASMAAAARGLDLPDGTLANGAGLKFAATAGAMGQNTRAAAVIWKWQGILTSFTVFPPVYATGNIVHI